MIRHAGGPNVETLEIHEREGPKWDRLFQAAERLIRLSNAVGAAMRLPARARRARLNALWADWKVQTKGNGDRTREGKLMAARKEGYATDVLSAEAPNGPTSSTLVRRGIRDVIRI
ncbi:MAG: hypothetical protein DMG49_12275 [Acidobacteria bacterium]|nr:MAG: hypothetical protein DMG49_12275 [Acidobacteriota bacterium]